jgi:putative chitinase
MITQNVLTAIGTPADTADKWLPWLNKTVQKYDIKSPRRQAMFLAQLAHESGNFRFTSENLNYSADALERVFKKYFPTRELAEEYARKPEKIANRVYANRMGNGDEASGDGWKYRGRGLIQLTGLSNYASYALQADNEAIIKPDIVAEPEYAADSAGWFWAVNRLNAMADTGDVRAVTRRVNGGFNGLEDRESKYNTLIVLLEGSL